MQLIRTAVAAINQTPMDWDGNLRRILQVVQDARRSGVAMLCLPELCVTGYGCEDVFYSAGVQDQAWSLLRQIAPATESMVVTVGLPRLIRGGLYNLAALLVDGRLVGLVAKQHLASDGLHYEPRWFKPWPAGVSVTEQIDGQAVPVGDLVFDCGGVRLGFEICEDAWVAARPGRRLMQRGVDVILNPSASHFAFGKHAVRRRFVVDGSRSFCVAYLYANLLGNEAGRAIYDGDTMIASCGAMLAYGPRFCLTDSQVTAAVIDIHKIRVQRALIGSFAPSLQPDDEAVVDCGFSFPECEPDPLPALQVAWEGSDQCKEEEFTRSISLALWDYLRKSRSRGFVVSLSGGADSAAVATLCAVMVHRVVDALGMDEVWKRLFAEERPDQVRTGDDLVPLLLTCVYQATRNSSDVTYRAAKELATALHATFHRLELDSIVDQYTAAVATAVGRELSWADDDLALQNIQARARGPSVWMIANLTGALLLATSNRSEAAVGYATMDGDTCGGLSPIAGIDKDFLRQWLSWMETVGPEGMFAVPTLSGVNVQAPTAELRPHAMGQTDEADLMPYDLLDAVERAAIRDKQPPLDVFRLVRTAFPQYSTVQLHEWVQRFFQLWSRNQWKRERYAPSFHVDDENLDPKTWCRFPILSGGYQRELRELSEYVRSMAAKSRQLDR